jgi:hypothetical protein
MVEQVRVGGSLTWYLGSVIIKHVIMMILFNKEEEFFGRGGC